MSWIYLLIAGLLEIAWSTGMKMSAGFTKLLPSIFTVVTSLASFILLGVALKKLPLSVAYAVWTGIGTVGTVLFGVLYFHEPITFLKIICVAMIVCGIIGLRLLS